MASLFFENSTRTRETHEEAAERLGMRVKRISGSEGTSMIKGEPLKDVLTMYQGWNSDVLVMRHHLEGSARFAADILDIPVINGGDGSNGHPTQAMLDLMTIQEAKGSIDGLHVALIGDLRFGRTVHSLIQALSLYDAQLTLVAPKNLQMPSHFIADYRKKTGKDIHQIADMGGVLGEADVLYMTRIQRERFPKGPVGEYEYKKVAGLYRLTPEMVHGEIIMHPLPRCKDAIEIDMAVDKLENNWYHRQAANGIPMRMALLHHVLENGTKKQEHQYTEAYWHNFPPGNRKREGDHVYRLDNGTLIDHIEPGKGKLVMKILGLEEYRDTPVVYVGNLDSRKYGKKDVLGITDRELSLNELSKLALVTKEATVNIVRDRRVVKKGCVVLPSVVKGIIACQNQLCVSYTDHNEFAPSVFYVEEWKPLQVRCHYCETPADRNEIILL